MWMKFRAAFGVSKRVDFGCDRFSQLLTSFYIGFYVKLCRYDGTLSLSLRSSIDFRPDSKDSSERKRLSLGKGGKDQLASDANSYIFILCTSSARVFTSSTATLHIVWDSLLWFVLFRAFLSGLHAYCRPHPPFSQHRYIQFTPVLKKISFMSFNWCILLCFYMCLLNPSITQHKRIMYYLN
jgi:hypothetical protein